MSLDTRHTYKSLDEITDERTRYSLNQINDPSNNHHKRDESTPSERYSVSPPDGRRTLIKKGLKHLRSSQAKEIVYETHVATKDKVTIWLQANSSSASYSNQPDFNALPLTPVTVEMSPSETVSVIIQKAITAFNQQFASQRIDYRLKDTTALWELFCAKKNGEIKPDYPRI